MIDYDNESMTERDSAIQRLKDIGLEGDALASACSFIEEETTKAAFVTVDDLTKIATANGWKNKRTSVMRELGLRSMPFGIRIHGIKTRIWQRGVARDLKLTDQLPRYRPYVLDDDRIDVRVSKMPPLPY
ncbi:hypothetical protein ACRAVF_19095 [Bradyrhizobium oligotrophicum S58]